ncbi:hypothetical protein J6TS1_42480 [Siminovitchia terrae]|uniref:Uncharacterized protein n=1 Tax=Siminovitchia terrae TaxID=1914933 RepID=A0A429XC33_SIMTE|nr:hypothetical protein [Siminovitchia terrae]RST60543.1 hypothetical protein D5F11_006840 [Siminovitchia terrae]GIN93892.1 hypothetical protein J22TS1_49430 [Siminovitchia terrae]GIN98378.1 hypothetical protein J6TS1_42480 [Siminovitchia terrae]
MKPDKKAKWFIGAAGAAFSAFVLTQIDNPETAEDPNQPDIVMDESMSDREKELLALDWTNYEITPDQSYEKKRSDRTTRRT